jgi:hypothetical protein
LGPGISLTLERDFFKLILKHHSLEFFEDFLNIQGDSSVGGMGATELGLTFFDNDKKKARKG